MAWYYGVNNSELYGSNFSTVLADAPPPLDDSFDEDYNEIVFRDDVNKSKKYSEKPVTSPVQRRQSSEEKLNDKSKLDGGVSKGENEHDTEGPEGVEEESDFGDFASFANFGSAFEQDSSSGGGESQSWFTGDQNNMKSFQAWNAKSGQQEQSAQDEDDEYADFAAFQENESIKESIPDGGFDKQNSNSGWLNKSACEDTNSSNINGSYDLESDDDFGDFATTENTITCPGEISLKNGKEIIKSHPDVELSSAPQGRTSTEENYEYEEVSFNGKRHVQCNGDLDGDKLDIHLEQPIGNHITDNQIHNVSEKDCNGLGESSLSEQKNELRTEEATCQAVPSENSSSSSGGDHKDHESRSLGTLSASLTCDEYHSSQSFASTCNEETKKVDKAHTLSSKNNGKEGSKNLEQLAKKNDSAASLHNSVTCKQGTVGKLSPENVESHDDSFGEFADFNDHSSRQTFSDNNGDEEFVDERNIDAKVDKRVVGGALHAKPALVEDKDHSDDDDDFGHFGSFEENHDKKYESASDSVATDATLTTTTNNKNKPAKSQVIKDNSFETEASPAEDKDNDDDDFGHFGSFEENRTRKDEKAGDFVLGDSKRKSWSNENKDEDEFEGFGAFKSNSDGVPEDNNQNDSFGNFDAFNSEDKPLQTNAQSGDDSGDFGAFKSSAINSQKQNGDNDSDFGDFGSCKSNVKDSQNNGKNTDDFGGFGSFESKARDSQIHDGNANDFGHFGSFEANAKDSQKNNSNTDDFGDFGSFKANTKDPEKCNENTDDFGDFGNFVSNAKDLGRDPNLDSFGEFGAFNSQAADCIKKSETDDDFGDFGTFESKEKALVPNENHGSSSGKSFNASETKANRQFKKNAPKSEFGTFSSNSTNLNTSRETDNDFGDFSSGNEKKSGEFDSFSSSTTSLSISSNASSGKNVDLKQQSTGFQDSSHFSPGINVVIKQAGDPISVCFTSTSELRHISNCQCVILSTRVEKSLHSNMGLWQHLEHSEKEGRILFNWSNSFSQHKKFLSLSICPERPPPLQAGSMLKPMVSSQFSPLGGGLAGALLMPAPPSKMPQLSSGMAFLEPLKGSQMPVHFTPRDKVAAQDSHHPEMGLPDLSFILGGNLQRTASKSDVKDNISDTAAESSSLDLDFFAPSTTQPHDGKTESRGLYEEDLLGLNIFSSSVEQQKLDSPKPQKASDSKKVWQHGGVTIPLSSQQKRAQLSDASKSILEQLEDLTFMKSSVLMFPLKTE